MKWYKHISDSLDDPFIFDLMTEFGCEGYVAFFGIIEIYSREFLPENGWKLSVSLSYLHQKLRISSLKVKKILSKIYKWDVSYDADKVTIFIPKFTELMDEWTQRKLGSRSGVTPVILTHDTDKDKEEDKDKRKVLKEKIQLIENQFQTIPNALMEKWREVAPGINIPNEIKKAELWLLAHPEKRRSRYDAFLSNWMVKAQGDFIKYGGNGNGKRTNTYRTDIRGHEVPDESERINAEWRAAKATKQAAADNARRISGGDDAPHFPSG
jgi:hypothetical protein